MAATPSHAPTRDNPWWMWQQATETILWLPTMRPVSLEFDENQDIVLIFATGKRATISRSKIGSYNYVRREVLYQADTLWPSKKRLRNETFFLSVILPLILKSTYQRRVAARLRARNFLKEQTE